MATKAGTSFGELLKRLRLEAGLTQEALAERAHLSTKTLAGLERHLHRIPRLETINLLSDALDLNPQQRTRLLAAARPETLTARPADEALTEPSHPTQRAVEPPLADSNASVSAAWLRARCTATTDNARVVTAIRAKIT